MRKKPVINSSHHRAATELLERPFDYWIPNDPKAVREAMDSGKPLATSAPRSNIAKAIRRIGKQTAAALPPRSGIQLQFESARNGAALAN